MARSTTEDPDVACGTSPSYWFAMLELALRRGDDRRARECRGQLTLLGVDIENFDITVTVEREEQPLTFAMDCPFAMSTAEASSGSLRLQSRNVV